MHADMADDFPCLFSFSISRSSSCNDSFPCNIITHATAAVVQVCCEEESCSNNDGDLHS